MAALDSFRLTLADLQKLMDPSGRVSPVAELLDQANEIYMDIGWQPGNLPTGHQWSQRTALPTASLRDYNEGVLPSKSAVAQSTAGMSIIEAWSEVDEAEANLNGNKAGFRAQEDAAFVESLDQKFVNLLIYGSTASDPKAFNGLATLNPGLGQQCISAGGTTASAQTSIYVCEWGSDLFGIYPKGSSAGLQHIDHGRQIIQFSDNTRMAALVSQFIWTCGLVRRDPRATARIANIEVSHLTGLTGAQELTDYSTNILYRLSDVLYRLQRRASGKRVIYMNRVAHAALAKMCLAAANGGGAGSALTIQSAQTQFGTARQWMEYQGIPIRCVDQIVNTEAVVS